MCTQKSWIHQVKKKYLGDILTDDGKLLKTIEDRKCKGHGLSSQIQAILSEIPLGKFKIQMGVHLRQAMLINGMIFNSEAWHGLTDTHVKEFQIIDNQVLRKIFNSHSKTSLAFLNLELGILPVKFIIASRRLKLSSQYSIQKRKWTNSESIFYSVRRSTWGRFC